VAIAAPGESYTAPSSAPIHLRYRRADLERDTHIRPRLTGHRSGFARQRGDPLGYGPMDARTAETELATARRRCLRLLTYGLYAVTVCRGDEHSGFTANWVTQVSFEPSLIALSVENSSHSIGMIRESRIFTVNILPSGARDTAGLLGRRWSNAPDKLQGVDWDPGPSGCAVLRRALGYLECHVEADVPAGDSTVFVARVVGARLIREGAPLTMAESGFKHAG
jgi:flavin reductase (DIM6/NTAB) family NADH-FMN oxidoreductase RutF